MKILLTGGDGYIANAIYTNFSNFFDITKISRRDIDLLDTKKVHEFLKSANYFDIIINTASIGGNRFQPDNEIVLENNLKIFYNFYNNKHLFNKFINIGSGAEIYKKDTNYGLSKFVINEFIKNTPNFYNLRIFGIFDYNDSDKRFIKYAILNDIYKNDIIIENNRYFDYIFMEDFLFILENYINNNINLKEYNCVYKEKYKLSDIATIITSFGKQSKIIIKNEDKINYIGSYIENDIDFKKMNTAIIQTYGILQNINT
jgi:dTDP-4-dehydrorhamnose reductase